MTNDIFSPESIIAGVRKRFEEEHGNVPNYFANTIKDFLDEVKASGDELLPITSIQEDAGEEVYNSFPEYIAAEMFAPMLDMGVIKIEEVSSWINDPALRERLNLTEAEAKNFIESTIPMGIQRFKDNAKRERERLIKLREAEDKAFCDKWNVDRLNVMSSHFTKNVKQAQKINKYWGDILTFYEKKLYPDLKKLMDNPDLGWKEKKEAIEQALKRIMYIFPSEVAILDERERELGIPYIDTLFKLAVELYKTAGGKDPDDDSIKMPYGMSITVSIAGDPATMRRFHRSNALDGVPRYGAKQFGNTTNFLRRGVKYTPPQQYTVVSRENN